MAQYGRPEIFNTDREASYIASVHEGADCGRDTDLDGGAWMLGTLFVCIPSSGNCTPTVATRE